MSKKLLNPNNFSINNPENIILKIIFIISGIILLILLNKRNKLLILISSEFIALLEISSLESEKGKLNVTESFNRSLVETYLKLNNNSGAPRHTKPTNILSLKAFSTFNCSGLKLSGKGREETVLKKVLKKIKKPIKFTVFTVNLVLLKTTSQFKFFNLTASSLTLISPAIPKGFKLLRFSGIETISLIGS